MHNRAGKVIHWELCKKRKFYHTTKWFMCKPESVQKKETRKIFWDFEIKTDHHIPVGRSDLVIINKKKKKRKKKERKKEILMSCGFCRLSGPQIENQRKRKERRELGHCQRTKKAVEHKGDGDTNCNWRAWNGPQRFGKGT